MDHYQRLIVEKGRKDRQANLAYRVELRQKAEASRKARETLIEWCREDVLFWLNGFTWLHEPRVMRDAQGRPLPDIVPFITWTHQDPIIRQIRDTLGMEDIGIEKSRGEGMSWIAVLLALHDWIFAVPGQRMVSIGMVSRTKEFADTPGNMNSLFAKIDWELEQLPVWMVGRKERDWRRNLAESTLRNLRNGSLISAYASKGEVGSGGRFTWWLMDELSKFPPGEDRKAMTSTQATTNSRLIIATPYGSTGAYYDVMHQPSAMLKLVLDWKDNPTRNRGLYRFVGTRPVAVDPVNNPLPPHYSPPDENTLDLFSRLRKKGFRLDKGFRSPWYDHECDRADANPYSIAQEYDRDYGGSLYKIFTDDFFQAATASVCRPYCRVQVDYDEEQLPLVTPAEDGLLHLWMTLDAKHRPPPHPFIIGIDLSTGLGGSFTSNSVMEIIDALTMEQVGELVSNIIDPAEFANLAVATCHWLGDAYLAWERNGPGNAFTMRIKQIGYHNLYMQPNLFDRRSKKTRKPGWWTDGRSKEVLFAEAKRIVTVGELKVHSDPLVKECHQYIRAGKDIVCAADARASKEGDSGEAHGDRVIAFGVAVQALRDRPVNPLTGETAILAAQPGSIEERDLMHRQQREQQSDDWDERENWDLAHGRSGQPVGLSFGRRW